MATSGGGTVLWSCGRVLRTGPRPPGRVDSPWTTRQARVAHRLPTLAGLSPTTPQDRQPIFSQVVFTTGTHAFDPDQPIGSKSPKSLLTSEASRPIIPSSRKRHPTSTSIANRSISPSLSHWTTGRRASTPDKVAGPNASGLILGAPTFFPSKSTVGRENRPARLPGFGVAVRKSTPEFVSVLCQKTATASRFGPISEIFFAAQLSDWKQHSESDRLGARFATSTRPSYPVRADFLKHLI